MTSTDLQTVGCDEATARQLELLAQALNLEQVSPRRLEGEGIAIEVKRVQVGGGQNSQQCEKLTYLIDLPGWPKGLRLVAETQESSFKAARGELEVETGDADFDDLFWIEARNKSETQTYLATDRRSLLLELVADEFLSPSKGTQADISLEEGQLKGYILLDLVTLTIGSAVPTVSVQERLVKFKKLRDQIQDPPRGLRRSRPSGWVNAEIRDKAGTRMWMSAFVQLVVAIFGFFAVGLPRIDDADSWFVGVSLLGSLSLAVAGHQIKAGWFLSSTP